MELLIAVTITTLMVAGILAVYLKSLTAWHEGSVQLTLQRKSSMVMERMVRGVDGTNGIREAGNITVPNSYTIQYASGVDGTERSFYLSGSDIMYDSDTSLADDESSIAEKISSLTFTLSGNMVTITLNMQEAVRDRNLQIDLTTRIKVRN